MEEVYRLIESSGANAVGVAVLSLDGEVLFGVDADRAFHPASTIKLCVMLEAYRRDRVGSCDLGSPICVQNEFRSIFDGSPFSLDRAEDSDPDLYEWIGREVPACELIERMITRSSNLATNVLLGIFRPEAVTAFSRNLGAEGILVLRGVEDVCAHSHGLDNRASARDLSILLTRLAAGTAVSPDRDSAMIQILLRQEHNQGVPRYLPPSVQVAHKTGWTGTVFHDAAIVYPPGEAPYVLTVMTEGLTSLLEGSELVAQISQLVFKHRDERSGVRL